MEVLLLYFVGYVDDNNKLEDNVWIREKMAMVPIVTVVTILTVDSTIVTVNSTLVQSLIRRLYNRQIDTNRIVELTLMQPLNWRL